jgi:hypothetical protein
MFDIQGVFSNINLHIANGIDSLGRHGIYLSDCKCQLLDFKPKDARALSIGSRRCAAKHGVLPHSGI